MTSRFQLALFLLTGCAPTQPPGLSPPPSSVPSIPGSDPAALREAAARYRASIDPAIEYALSSSPVWATFSGDHRFDDQLDEFEQAAQARQIAELRAHAKRLAELIPTLPNAADVGVWGTEYPQLDAEIVANQLEGRALTMEKVSPPERDPSQVVSHVGAAVTSIVSHEYAPKPVRFAALARRLERVPELLLTAEKRIRRPTLPALENLAIVSPGVSANLRGNIAKTDPAALGGAALSERLGKAALAAADAVDGYAKRVAERFPAAKAADDPIGSALWAQLARLREGVTETPTEVRRMGLAELSRLEAELAQLMPRLARQGETPAKLFERLSADSPEPARLLDEYRELNARVEAWLKETPFVTVPWEKLALQIVQTPAERRGLSLASMNVAGVLEPALASAHFEVNVPDDAMPKPRRDALRAFHARGAIELVSVHEAIPGHYLQALHNRNLSSKARKLFRSATTGEGWAHYCEVAVLKAGYEPKNPDVVNAFAIRLAMQRAARVLVDVGANDGSLSFGQGAQLLEQKAFLAPDAARIEARRAFVSPANMFTYTYGKLVIMTLRERIQVRDGSSFDLAAFHDRLLSLGSVPVRQIGPVAFGAETRY